MWLVLPCICGACVIGVLADVWYGWGIIGVLLLSFVVAFILVGMETLIDSLITWKGKPERVIAP